MQFAELPEGGGQFFEPAKHASSVAIVFDVTRLEPQRPGQKYGPKDAIHADVFSFKNDAQLAAGEPEALYGQIIQQTMMVRDLTALVGNATIATLEKIPTANGSGWVLRAVKDAGIQAKIAAWATKRKQEQEAAQAAFAQPVAPPPPAAPATPAPAAGAMPSFLQ